MGRRYYRWYKGGASETETADDDGTMLPDGWYDKTVGIVGACKDFWLVITGVALVCCIRGLTTGA